MQKTLYVFIAFFSMCYFQGIAQNEVKGTIKNKNNDPLLGVNVIIKGHNEGTVSDFDGNFTLTTTQDFPFVLEFSSMGFEKKEVEVKDGSMINIVLDDWAALANLVGVDVAEDNIGQYSVTLRGDRYPFGNNTLVMVDNRNIKIPGFDYSDFNRIPLLSQDYERIEVTRGPASALYGPGVSSGVIHYQSKSPIKYPGTTITIGGGLRSTIQAGVKHAEKINNNLGFKISAKFFKANAWEYDANNAQDAQHLVRNSSQFINPISRETIISLEPDELQNTDVQSFGVAANFEYRKAGHLVNFNAGYTEGRSPFYIDRGDGYWDFPSTYVQLRYSKGGFFVQYDNNYITAREGDSYSYKSGEVFISKNVSNELQAQYNFDVFKDKLNISVGGEYRVETTDSKGTIYGRFEEEDDFGILGGYLFLDYEVVKDKLNLKATGRVDNFIALEATEVSPQLALVYKPVTGHSFRASWSKTATPTPAVDTFGDVTLTAPSAEEPFFLNFLGGNATFDYDNPVTNTFIPTGDPNSPFLSFDGTDLPLPVAYGVALQQIGASGALPAPILAFLESKLPSINGVSAPLLINPLTSLPYDQGATPLAAKSAKLRPTILENFEIGYKGYIGKKLAVEVTSYWGRALRINTQFSNPLSIFPTISQDLTAAATGAISDAEYAQIGQQIGMSGDEARGILAGAFTQVGNGLAAQPLGTIAHSQANKFPGFAEIQVTTQTIDTEEEIEWGGLEFGASFNITDQLSIFANYNFVNNDFNNNDIINTGLTPRNRIKAGVDFIQDKGLSGGISARYQDAYTARFEQGYGFSGVVPSFTVVDANVSYGFKNDVVLAVSAQNILNEEYRAYPFTPKIGTMVLGKLTYSF